MTEESKNDPVLRVLRIVADRLESFLEGDETALETLAESLEQAEVSGDDLQAAILVLRSLSGGSALGAAVADEQAPGKQTHRVLSAEERAILAPEAWGYLLALRSQGSLDAEQCERVLDLVAESSVRPVNIEQIREAAVRIALTDGLEGTGEAPLDLSH